VYRTAVLKAAVGKMTLIRQLIPVAVLASVLIPSPYAQGQVAAPAATQSPSVPQPSPAPATTPSLSSLQQSTGPLSSGAQLLLPLRPLLDFRDSDIKFNLGELMSALRDNRHEGWVLAAYPDPKTSRPLIGAGFSLDIPAREHPQSDPLNPIPFLEPSSAQLWQAAGLDSAKLQSILQQYDDELDAWQKTRFRRKIRTHALTPELTEDEATQLLRISAIQAIHNARAYCRNFDQMSGYQQMALSQLVFQMGVNLEEFTHFLAAMNDDSGYRPAALSGSDLSGDAEHWKTVQSMLIQSDWARRYYSRAVSVIAMFDPNYASDPFEAERKVSAQLHPLHRRHAARRAASVKTASAHKKSSAHHTARS
jgi:hypothetical protein